MKQKLQYRFEFLVDTHYPPKEKICEVCGEKFFDRSKNQTKNTCSRKCRYIVYSSGLDKESIFKRKVDMRINVLRSLGVEITADQRIDIDKKLKSGTCDCCHGIFEIRQLAIDHDHKTGLYRGVLCRFCNTAIGLAKEDIKRLEGIIEYLKLTDQKM
jgi:hypothetical protein